MVVYLVLRASNLVASRNFYEQLGLDFTAEQHGGGPLHYATASSSSCIRLAVGRRPVGCASAYESRTPSSMD
jgi:hypothetical protein